jgi:hypothetical protein
MESVGAVGMRSDVGHGGRLMKDSFPDCEVCQVALVLKRVCLVSGE